MPDTADQQGTSSTRVVGPSEPAEEHAPSQTRRQLKVVPGAGDRVFLGLTRLGGFSVLAIMAAVGSFLSIRAFKALSVAKLSFLTTQAWQPDSHRFGIATVLTGTVLIAIVALAISVPMALGTSLFISEVAPRQIKQTLTYLVDLMAAVPSVVYGIWGVRFLQGHAVGLARFISTWFSWIPIFKVAGADPTNPTATATVYTTSTFIAGIVVALMVMPIQCSVMREAFSQAPAGEREGAYALGATRWGMITSVVLPFGKGGIIGGTMLGLGRALGETIAVYLIISPVVHINFHILQAGANSISSLIALQYGDSSGFGLSALMAAGLALFILTLIVNFTASSVIARSRSGAQSEG
jgi:phosphate transport system permease protein